MQVDENDQASLKLSPSEVYYLHATLLAMKKKDQVICRIIDRLNYLETGEETC